VAWPRHGERGTRSTWPELLTIRDVPIGCNGDWEAAAGEGGKGEPLLYM
jgi:hypothetical protein